MKNESKEFFIDLTKKALKKTEDEFMKNLDSSKMTKEHKNKMLNCISRCETELDILLTQTEEVNGFGSYYPEKCLSILKTFKTILELEF